MAKWSQEDLNRALAAYRQGICGLNECSRRFPGEFNLPSTSKDLTPPEPVIPKNYRGAQQAVELTPTPYKDQLEEAKEKKAQKAAVKCLSLYDIINVVKDGQSSPNKFSETQEEGPKFLKSTHERDFKLINLVLSFEYYTLIVVGAGLRKPGLLVPWLTLYAFIIIGDIIVFFVQLCNDGCNFDKNFLCSGILLAYNWLAVFCLFLHIKMDKKF
ncbi:hypothetical protein RN001_013555 [Aquatica leii]|uniref:Uncharacterized protein n=1 Tax=Aquatica leii TaxID=1421715 RepID=A0AAN7NWG6_9COLE|nr:hypothetical protein RN001_013555 [Aquatica leii]